MTKRTEKQLTGLHMRKPELFLSTSKQEKLSQSKNLVSQPSQRQNDGLIIPQKKHTKEKYITGINSNPFEKNSIKRLDTENISNNIKQATHQLSTIYQDFEQIAEDIQVEMPSASEEHEKYFDAVDDLTKRDDDEKQANIVEQLQKETDVLRTKLNIPQDVVISTEHLLNVDAYLQNLFKLKIDYDKKYPENSNYVRHSEDLEQTSPNQIGRIIKTKNDDPFLEESIKSSSILVVQTNIPKRNMNTDELIRLNRKPHVPFSPPHYHLTEKEKELKLNIKELENLYLDTENVEGYENIQDRYNHEAKRRVKLKQLLAEENPALFESERNQLKPLSPHSPQQLTRSFGRSQLQTKSILKKTVLFPSPPTSTNSSSKSNSPQLPSLYKTIQVVEPNYNPDHDSDMIDEEIQKDAAKDRANKRCYNQVLKEQHRRKLQGSKRNFAETALHQERSIENKHNLDVKHLKQYDFPFLIPDCLNEHCTERLIISNLIRNYKSASQHLQFLNEEKSAIQCEEFTLRNRIKHTNMNIEQCEKKIKTRNAIIRQREIHLRTIKQENDSHENNLKRSILQSQNSICDLQRELLSLQQEYDRESSLHTIRLRNIQEKYEKMHQMRVEEGESIMEDILVCKELYEVFDNEMDGILDVTRKRDDYLCELNQMIDQAIVSRNTMYSYILELSKSMETDTQSIKSKCKSRKSGKSGGKSRGKKKKIFVGSNLGSLKSTVSTRMRVPISFHTDEPNSSNIQTLYSASTGMSSLGDFDSPSNLYQHSPATLGNNSLKISLDFDNNSSPAVPESFLSSNDGIARSPTMMAINKRIRVSNLNRHKSQNQALKPKKSDHLSIKIDEKLTSLPKK